MSRSSFSRTSTTVAPDSRSASSSSIATGSVVSSPPPRTYPATSSSATERRPAMARSASAAVCASTTTGRSASSTKPALVEKLVPDTGTLTAPARWPARCSATGRTSRSCASSCGAGSSGAGGEVGRNGPRFTATIRARFGGLGLATDADSATNASSAGMPSMGLNRRSKPIVVELRELIEVPQSDPAT